MIPPTTSSLLRRATRGWLLGAALLGLSTGLAALEGEDEAIPGYADDEEVGIDEKLGETVPLDLELIGEDGEAVTLDELIDKPTILTLVYLRCPSICSPLLHELAAAVDSVGLEPGSDYDLLTVSFDITDDEDLAATAKRNLLEGMEREIPEQSWRFLTGEAQAIARLTDAVGFRFRREQSDFVHAGSIIFLSAEGKIVRYLPGLRLLPADLKLAVHDAAAGRPRSIVKTLQRLCYAYDPEGQTYALRANRIVLLLTLPALAAFLGYLLFKKREAPSP